MAGPLTDENKKEINDQLANLKTVREEIKRAKLAGLDMATEEAETDRLEKQLNALKAAYFPTGRG